MMKQVLQYDRAKQIKIENIPSPQIKSIGLVVDNRSSLISVGTEKAIINQSQKSLAGKAKQRPDVVKQVIEKVKTEGIASTYNKVMGRLKAPIPLGYSSAGIVKEVHKAVDKFTVGDRVACAGFGYATHSETIFVPSNLAVKIPDNVSFDEASFVTLGAIALQGVRVAEPKLGETVTVIGLGLLGQITTMLLKASGCRVIGIDIDPEKLTLAKECGADETYLSGSDTIDKVIDYTSGFGTDSVIITAATESDGPVNLAGEICREKGVVVVVGAVNMNIPRKPYYDKELELRLSRSYGPGRYDYNYEEGGHDYPFGYVRWTENRNMESFLQLIADKKIDVNPLITHRYDIEDAEKGYELVCGKTDEKFMGVLLNYNEKETTRLSIRTAEILNQTSTDNKSIGFIGTGGFATGVLLPRIKDISTYNLHTVMSGSGISAASAQERFGFENVVSTTDEIIKNREIGTVFIVNRHNQHFEMVMDALSNGKNVFVEKPLCMNFDELNQIIDKYNEHPQKLMVGFNRRFAPQVEKIKEALAGNNFPLSMHYRINGGFIPSNNWLQDSEAGGGRIIGEVCHFIDLLTFIADSPVTKVSAESLSMPGERYRSDDNLQIMIRLADGSVGTINYNASGNKRIPKEYLEIFGGGMTFILDDFRTLTTAVGSKSEISKQRSQDKGHKKMLELFAQSLSENKKTPIAIEQIINTTAATLSVIEALERGEAVWLTK